MSITLKPVSPSDEAGIRAYHDVVAAVGHADLPDTPPASLAHSRAEFRCPRPATESYRFVADRDGHTVGALSIDLPMADNRHSVSVDLWVHPAHRRQGVGRALFGRAAGLAREHGRSLLIGAYCGALPGGPERDAGPAAFAAAMGAADALPEVRRRLELDTVDTATWTRLRDTSLACAKGYTLARWVGPVPDEHAAAVAYLEGRMGTDAPMGDLQYEPENYDAERVWAAGEVNRLRGEARYHAVALDDSSGRVVAWTVLGFDVDEQAHAWQGTTIVDPDHRGHRLGILVKIENLIHTREHRPGLRTIDTWNAAENAYMISINEAVGFRALDAWVTWQYAVPS